MTLILIGFGESLATPEVYWSLRSDKFEVAAFFRRGSRSAARSLRGLRVIDVTGPEQSVDAFRDEVQLACEQLSEEGCRGVLPMDDASLMLLHNQNLGLPFLGPKGEQAALAIDKSLQFSLANDSGFRVPEYVVTGHAHQTVEAIEGLGESAVIAKPARIGEIEGGRLTRPSARYFETPKSAIGWLQSKGEDHSPWIVQRVVNGNGEGVFGIATPSGLRSVSGHRRVRMMNPAGSGSSACVSVPIQPEIKSASGKFCERAHWSGLFMIELLRDRDDKVWFMELNGRPWGSMALARRRGLEYPLWHVHQALGSQNCPDFEPDSEILCRHLGRELVHLLFVLRGNKQGAPGWPSRTKTIWSLLKIGGHTRWYNSDPSQRTYALRDAVETVRTQLR